MTPVEFQRRYCDYSTHDRNAAVAEAAKVNQEGIDGDRAVVVHFGPLGYSLMLKSTSDVMIDIDVLSRRQDTR